MGGPANPYIRVGEPVTLLAGGQDPPPHCRAAWGTGRPAAGRPVLQGPRRKFSAKLFTEKPLPPGSGAARCWPPGSGAAGIYSCKFRKRKYIFVKNENKKYKNIKIAGQRQLVGLSVGLSDGGPGETLSFLLSAETLYW